MPIRAPDSRTERGTRPSPIRRTVALKPCNEAKLRDDIWWSIRDRDVEDTWSRAHTSARSIQLVRTNTTVKKTNRGHTCNSTRDVWVPTVQTSTKGQRRQTTRLSNSCRYPSPMVLTPARIWSLVQFSTKVLALFSSNNIRRHTLQRYDQLTLTLLTRISTSYKWRKKKTRTPPALMFGWHFLISPSATTECTLVEFCETRWYEHGHTIENDCTTEQMLLLHQCKSCESRKSLYQVHAVPMRKKLSSFISCVHVEISTRH